MEFLQLPTQTPNRTLLDDCLFDGQKVQQEGSYKRRIELAFDPQPVSEVVQLPPAMQEEVRQVAADAARQAAQMACGAMETSLTELQWGIQANRLEHTTSRIPFGEQARQTDVNEEAELLHLVIQEILGLTQEVRQLKMHERNSQSVRHHINSRYTHPQHYSPAVKVPPVMHFDSGPDPRIQLGRESECQAKLLGLLDGRFERQML
jgi:hypothetical protein